MFNLLACFLKQREKLARAPLPFLFGGHARAHVPMDASVHILTCQPTLQNNGLNRVLDFVMVDFKEKTGFDSNGLPHKQAHRVLQDKSSCQLVSGHCPNPGMSRATMVLHVKATSFCFLAGISLETSFVGGFLHILTMLL